MRNSGRLALAAMVLAFIVDVLYVAGMSYEAVAYPGGIAFGMWLSAFFVYLGEPESVLV